MRKRTCLLLQLLVHQLVLLRGAGSCEAEVTEVNAALVINEHIGWLDVSVDEAGSVHIVERAQ